MSLVGGLPGFVGLSNLDFRGFQAFAFFNNHKILPNVGGFCDQSDNFHKVINLAGKVESLVEAEKQKRKKGGLGGRHKD